jgi:hypothetical protein
MALGSNTCNIIDALIKDSMDLCLQEVNIKSKSIAAEL